ncbi:TETRASPANIN [Salix viminalis]|uniref:TETRASPANIN n=1 Tax=Salix viminalis TaxID=40686 RepID=A0A9Q0TB13_SALVM|nr:TETRASPANIN [Salix viminalis]
MAGIARTCLQSILKIVNSTLGLVGIAMVIYGLWMGRVWQRDMQDSSFDDFDSSAPWFIYTFLSIGVTLCLITCLGHISADCSNGFFLSCYLEIIFVLLLLETLIAADILLNSDWEKDLPEDPTGRLHDFREFVESNFDFFKWIGMFIIISQGFSMLLAMALGALGPNNESNYEIDEEHPPARLPLINHHLQQPPYVVGEPRFAGKSDAWNVRIHFQSTKDLSLIACTVADMIFCSLFLILLRPTSEETAVLFCHVDFNPSLSPMLESVCILASRACTV